MSIDLNADVGEGLDDVDAELLPLVTSANIACGGHAGDAATMARTVDVALRHGVAVGAHPGYPDRDGFGRRRVSMSDAELEEEVVRQVEALSAVAAAVGARLAHVKPHGALYNVAARDRAVAETVARAVHRCSPALVLVGLAGSLLLEAGREAGLVVAAEGFADRAYEPDGSLRPREAPGAVHVDPELVAAQAVAIARDRRVPLEGDAATGRAGATGSAGTRWVTVSAETLCLHADTPRAVANARAVRGALAAAGVDVRPFGLPVGRPLAQPR